MKKLSLSISRALLLGALVILPTAIASAQTAAAPAQDDKQATFEREWYDTCYTKKDMAKCYEMSKVYKAQYPNGTYIKNAIGIVDNKEINDLWEQFQAALKDYYAGAPDAAKLDKLFNTGDAFLQRKPNYPYVVAQQALAATGAGLAEVYKDRAKINSYLTKAMSLYSVTTTTDEKAVKQEDWVNFRDNIMASGHQFMGWDVIQSKGDAKTAYGHLTKATQVRSAGNPGIGWKDPLNYYLRSNLINDEYTAAGAKYKALTDEQKTGDPGKEALKELNAVVDRILAEYARVIATSGKPEYKDYLAYAKGNFDSLWKYRTDAPEKAAAFLQGYVADPTVPDAVVPAKAESAAPPAGIPTAGIGAVKVTGGAGSAMPGAGGAKAATKPAAKGGKKKR